MVKAMEELKNNDELTEEIRERCFATVTKVREEPEEELDTEEEV
jgi:hypothetical protein